MAQSVAIKIYYGDYIFMGREKMFTVGRKYVSKLIPRLQSQNLRASGVSRTLVLVNWENMGDFILFSAVIRETKTNFPNSKLIVVAQKENAELAQDCPYVDKWIWIKGHKNPKPGEGHGKETSYLRKLVVTYFQLQFYGKRKIDFLLGPDWLLVTTLNQFVQNILFRKANQKDFSSTFQGPVVLSRIRDHSHQVTRMCSILEAFNIKVVSDEIENWLPLISEPKDSGSGNSSMAITRRVLVSLGAGQRRRNWPLENVRTLIDTLLVEYKELEVTVIGPKSLATEEVLHGFSNTEGIKSVIGQTDLSQVARFMKNSNLLISNDSGLVHLAATYKLPTVVISAHPTNADPWHLHSPNRYHPWKTRYKVLQPAELIHPCIGSCQAPRAHCIESIDVAIVFEACKELLDNNS